jgi:Phage head completion protein (GPL)
MSFLANQSPPAAASEPLIENDGWFPDVSPADVRAQARLDGTVTAPRLRAALLHAMADINGELASWRLTQQAAGIPSLEDLPGAELGGQSIWLVYYQQAIVSHVQCSLIEAYRDFDTTGSGDAKADGLEARIDSHRRDLRWAIAALQARPRTTVELI